MRSRVSIEQVIVGIGVIGILGLVMLTGMTLMDPEGARDDYCIVKGFNEAIEYQGEIWCKRNDGLLANLEDVKKGTILLTKPEPELVCISRGYNEVIVENDRLWCRGDISTVLYDDLIGGGE
jgi:hypothetical protein